MFYIIKIKVFYGFAQTNLSINFIHYLNIRKDKTLSEENVLASQQTIMHNQETIIKNQDHILKKPGSDCCQPASHYYQSNPDCG